jgi:hypothetical protein
MSYHLTIERNPGFLHVIATGDNTPEDVAAYLDEVRRECVANGCSKVLIEERLDGPRLRTVDVFEIATHGSRHAAGALHAIAYVDVNAEGDLMQFAETVAVNRTLPVRVFPTVDAAGQWLREC